MNFAKVIEVERIRETWRVRLDAKEDLPEVGTELAFEEGEPRRVPVKGWEVIDVITLVAQPEDGPIYVLGDAKRPPRNGDTVSW